MIKQPNELSDTNRPISFVGMSVPQIKQLLDSSKPINPTVQSLLNSIQTDLIDLEKHGQTHIPDSLQFKLDSLSNQLSQSKSSDPPTSRRSRFQPKSNTNPDINFATEIGQGLLIEVRKLQNVIQEKEEAIKRLEANKLENVRQSDSMQRQLKHQEEIQESLKEVNWNLELANQDLLSHLTDSNQSIAKHNADYARLMSQIKDQSEQMEIMKAQEEKKCSLIEAMKARHEQEMHQMRRHVANGQRENTQIQQQVDTLQTELKICKAKLTIKQTVNARTEVESEPTPTSVENDTQPSPAPVARSPQSHLETETLKQSLAHAHRIISNLRGSAHKEKLEKFELKKILSDSQETIEQLRREPVARRPKKKQKAKKRMTGVSRRPRGVASSSSSDKSSDSEEDPELSFGLGFGTPIQPLSSELDRIQVVDVGINTCHELTLVVFDGHSVDPIEDDKISPQVAQQWVQDALTKSRLETEALTVSRLIFDQTVAEAKQKEAELTNKLQKTVSVLEVSRAETKAALDEKANSLPKPDVDKLLDDLKSKSDEILAEAVAKAISEEKKNSVPKSEVEERISRADKLVAEAVAKAIAEEKEKTIPKMEAMASRADERVAEAIAEEKELARLELEKMLPRAAVDTLMAEAEQKASSREKENSAAKIEEMMINMVHKSRVDEIVAQAIEKHTVSTNKEPTILLAKADLLIAEARQEGIDIGKTTNSQNVVTKSKAEEMVSEAIRLEKEKVALTMISNVQVEQKIESVRLEAQQMMDEMIPKSEAEKAVLTVREQMELEMSTKSRSLIDQAVSKVQQDMTAEKDKLQQELKLEIAEKSKVNVMLEKALAEIDKRTEQLEKEVEKNAAAREDSEMRIASVRSELNQKIQDMISKPESEALIKQARNEMEGKHVEHMEKNMLTKEQHESAILDAVNKARSENQEKLQALVKKEEEVAEKHQKDVEEHHQEFEAYQKGVQKHQQELESHQKELEKALLDSEAEKDDLRSCFQILKKESEETNQRMKNMLTKESADVLIKRAISDALQKSEAKQQEVLLTMVSKVDADIMTKQAVNRALEEERKETEEREARLMISKAEAEALAKVAAADATVNERQLQAAREKEMISKEESERLTKQAIQDVIEKEKLKHAEILAKERKSIKEKEENMITKEKAEAMIAEAIHVALEKEKEANLKTVPAQEAQLPPIVPERSISTSRLAPPSIQIVPTPSVSTPPVRTKNRLHLTKSVSSFRKSSSDNLSLKKDAPRSSTDGHRGFGTLRILENTTYGSRKNASKTSLRNLSKQGSTTSFSTVATEETRTYPGLSMPSDDNISMFADNDGNTNMDVISSITQTMIGEWMMKHTRRYVGSGISEHRHKRFFWVHPYTKSLYWSSIEPGVDGSESRAKSAFIESIVVVSNQNQQETTPVSLLIHTPKRDIKITAPSLERHDIWHKAMLFLVGRNHSLPQASTDELPTETESVKIPTHDAHYDSDESEDMINIRQCCDGKHDLSDLSKKHSHS